MSLPLNTGACEWVCGAVGRPLDPAEQELVTVLCAGLSTGPWNIHRTWKIMRCHPGYYASMTVTRDLSTFDGDALLRLVFSACDRGLRLSVGASGPHGCRVSVWPKFATSDRRVVPSLESAVESWRKRYPSVSP